MSDKELTKVHVALPHHGQIGGETFWAVPKDDDTFEIQNVPFFAYGLHFKDIVRATSDADGILQVREVVRRSGFDTVRVLFDEGLPVDKALAEVEALKAHHDISAEHAHGRLFALCVRPTGDLERLRDALDALFDDGVLDYETTVERVPGSFDDEPTS